MRWWTTSRAPESRTAVTVHRSPFLTQSVALMAIVRSLRRVMIASPADACDESARVTWEPAGPFLLGEAVASGAAVQFGDQLAGGRQHDGVPAGGSVGRPGGVGVVGDGGQVADVDPSVVDVVGEGGRVTVA